MNHLDKVNCNGGKTKPYTIFAELLWTAKIVCSQVDWDIRDGILMKLELIRIGAFFGFQRLGLLSGNKEKKKKKLPGYFS